MENAVRVGDGDDTEPDGDGSVTKIRTEDLR